MAKIERQKEVVLSSRNIILRLGNREVPGFIGFHQLSQYIQPVALRGAGLRIEQALYLSLCSLVIIFGADRFNFHVKYSLISAG